MNIWRSDTDTQNIAEFSTELLHVPRTDVTMSTTSRPSGSRRSSPRYRSPSPSSSSNHIGDSPYQETTLVDELMASTITDTVVRPNSPQTDLVRRVTVKLSRHPDDEIGLGLSGGKENDERIFVSSVVQNGAADRAGLSVGDQIIALNNISINNFTLQEVLHILYSTSRKVQLTVIPSRDPGNIHSVYPHHYLWVDSEGRPVSPPLDFLYDSSYRCGFGGLEDGVRTVTLTVEKGLPLGLLIRGGVEDGLGIYVTGVESPSAAELAGLRVGDQILSVNDQDFQTISHDKAVDILKFSPLMKMTVRYVGKIPLACTPYSGQPWYQDHQQLSSPRLSRRGSSRKREKPRGVEARITSPIEEAEKILDLKAQQILTENERISLAYYCNEYETRAMTVDAFVAVLMELLENPEKYPLMTHIRGFVRREDVDKFDELIYKREIQAVESKEVVKQAIDQPGDCQTLSTSSTNEARSPIGSFRRKNVSHHHQLTLTDRLNLHAEAPSGENGCTSSQDSSLDVVDGNRPMFGTSKDARISLGSRLQLSNNQYKSYSCQPPRHLPHRFFDTHSGIKETINATLLRRLTLRRHSSGGEGVNPEERRNSGRVTEDRRWSLGSELLDSHGYERLEPRPFTFARLDCKSSSSPSSNSIQETCYNWLQVPHTRVRRHRSLPDPHAICTSKSQELELPQHQHRSASMRLPSHRTTTESNGRLRIIIKKTRPLLGIAIEGGANTGQPLPRIISIHDCGAAYEAGGLKVGHIILEVDGFRTSKMKHQEVAQLIADSFYNSDRDQLELLVVERARTELEIRRSSFMVLE
ncbi:whirlin-like [Tachypleus tridentatus]|uniref:whirlin-like n=1 Tax=Tachypleus tridentatus TaxID=6853 RepID=UPI003FD60F90